MSVLINLRIMSKPHAYLQSMVKVSVKNWDKTLRTQGTHYYRGTNGQKDGQTEGRAESRKLELCLNCQLQ